MKATPFEYTPVGELALVGKHSGVARVCGHNFSGPLAWAMWRAIYLAKMPGAWQKARILTDWLLDLTFGRTLSQSVRIRLALQRNHDIHSTV